MNNSEMINKIKEVTGRTEVEAMAINEILNSHNIIGHNNKEKIKNDFMEKLNLTEREADDLYNTCAEIIVKGIFRKN